MQINTTQLDNGLTIVHSQDTNTQMVATSLLYRVGSADETPQHTGLAHLMEHLMFGGSKNAPLFDPPLEKACGENNAFTTSDYTNYYITLPAVNIETALFLESDRMTGLVLTPRTLDVQRKVVMEEFKLHYINQPYGDLHHLLAALAYPKGHPYSWPTIGLNLSQIADVPLQVVQDFYRRFYAPDNAILAVVGNISWERTQELTRKWFAHIENPTPRLRGPRSKAMPPAKGHTRTVRRNVPRDLLVVAFHTPSVQHEAYRTFDVVSDLLATGKSSRLYQQLVEKQHCLLSADAYVMPRLQGSMLILEAVPAEGVSLQQAEQAVREQVERLRTEPVSRHELQKVLNKFEASQAAQRNNCQAVAMQLAYYTMLGDAELYNDELAAYRAITPQHLHQTICSALEWRHAHIIRYHSKTAVATNR